MIDLARGVEARVEPSAAWLRRHARILIGGAALLVVATLACALAGLSPWLPVVLAFLALVASRPTASLVYAIVVLSMPLGLWAIGVKAVVGTAFGDRDYMLDITAAAVVFLHFALTAIRCRPSRNQALAAAVAAAVLLASALVGFAHHGIPQTLIGVRYVLFPVAVLVVVVARSARDLTRLVGLLAWAVIANALAAVGEFIVGPPRLVAWGLSDGNAIRYIDGNFRAPGLTDFNAELGMLAGAYLLGYAGLWLTRDSRPRHRVWHAGAAAAAVCLALSTSRSGAVLLVAGLVVGVVLNRAGGAAARRRSRLLGLAVLVAVAVGFVAVGATGADSLIQRLDVWRSLLHGDVPLYGLGVGAVGAASNSRVAAGSQVFVDNYVLSVALQFGPVVAVAFVALIVAALVWLCRRSAGHPGDVLYIAVIAGLAASFLLIESWEYGSAMACLAVFVGYGLRHRPEPVP